MTSNGTVRRSSAAAMALLAWAISVGCASTANRGESGRRNVAELMPNVPVGYLAVAERPDSLKLLPPPPAAGSKAMAYDEEVRANALAMRSSPRWDLARRDASLGLETALESFECALGTSIDFVRTPRLFQMLQRVVVDAGYSTDGAKHHYRRTRPFVVARDGMCTPEEDEELRADGSYPSGHTALGWAVTLVLVELAPERADALLKRGISFGESRVVCNVHWQSDVVAGRTMGAAAVARLHANPDFLEDVVVARSEILNARQALLKPSRDCDEEATALARSLPGAL